ncbi:MAG: NADH-quinone oxidoreductase subunit A [Acidimicrobiales bacterium]|jgi:NADH-quinone oxidoreductase subunit A|nr:NADH-quinone oxidoreductase subunit A [Acidimicrobiales bacterium]
MAQYLPILMLLCLALVFAGLSRFASRLLAPRRPSLPKAAPYECGIVPGKEPPERFPVKFFLVAMIFIVFDIEIIFLFPYAVVHRELGAYGLVAVVIFVALVFESFVYLIGNGALDWGPVKRLREAAVVSPARTVSTTVRRVGTEGREPVAATTTEAA